MKIRDIVIVTTLLLSATAHGSEIQATPAWQEPSFVMEEVVATAPLPADPQALAWQEPGFVMEEVVATANRSEVFASVRAGIPPHLRILFAAHWRQHWLQKIRANGTALSSI